MSLTDNLTPVGTLTGQLAVGGPIPPFVSDWVTLTNASGALINFSTDVEGNFNNCFNTIQFKQAGSGTPAPTNPREITGFTFTRIYNNTNIYEVSFGAAGTVYKGTLDVMSGLLKVTHGYKELSSITWQTLSVYQSRRAFMSQVISDIKASSASSQIPDITCSHYQTVNGDGVYLANRQAISLWSTQQRFAIYDPDKESMDATQFQQSLTGVQAVYLLNTPITVQLTGAIVKSVVGSNSISINSGTLNITYQETVGHKLEG